MSNQNQNINQEKFDQFVEKLYSMGYGPELEEQETNEDIINMLEKHHLHEQDFDFPEKEIRKNFKRLSVHRRISTGTSMMTIQVL